MAVQLDLSHEFDSLVKKLQQDPDNPVLKIEVLKRMPEMKVLAQSNPVAMYRLAQAYYPASDEYNDMMTESAEKGCTNAMLTICHNKLKSTMRTQDDLKTVAHYMALIEQSKDSYIINQSRELLATHPEVAGYMKAEFNSNSYKTGIRFFSAPPPTNNMVQEPKNVVQEASNVDQDPDSENRNTL